MAVMDSGIYRIDLGNGHFYIGSSVNLARREGKHLRDLRRANHCNIKMQNCWNKYGVFEFTVLEVCSEIDLLVCEDTYLKTHFSDPKNVNLAPTAGSTLGYKHSDEHKAKTSAASKGRVCSVETRAKISAACKGRVVSAEARVNMCAAQKGRSLSDKTRATLSVAHKGKVLSVETRAKISAARKGIPRSAETRLRISLAHKLRRAKAAEKAFMLDQPTQNLGTPTD